MASENKTAFMSHTLPIVITKPMTKFARIKTPVRTAKYRAIRNLDQPSFVRDRPRYTTPTPKSSVKPGAHRCVSVRIKYAKSVFHSLMGRPSISVSRPVPWDQLLRARPMWSMAIRSIKRPRSRSGGSARELGLVGLDGSGGSGEGSTCWMSSSSAERSGGRVP